MQLHPTQRGNHGLRPGFRVVADLLNERKQRIRSIVQQSREIPKAIGMVLITELRDKMIGKHLPNGHNVGISSSGHVTSGGTHIAGMLVVEHAFLIAAKRMPDGGIVAQYARANGMVHLQLLVPAG